MFVLIDFDSSGHHPISLDLRLKLEPQPRMLELVSAQRLSMHGLLLMSTPFLPTTPMMKRALALMTVRM
jgi:hypothetical protein